MPSQAPSFPPDSAISNTYVKSNRLIDQVTAGNGEHGRISVMIALRNDDRHPQLLAITRQHRSDSRSDLPGEFNFNVRQEER